MSARYERARIAAQQKLDGEKASLNQPSTTPTTQSPPSNERGPATYKVPSNAEITNIPPPFQQPIAPPGTAAAQQAASSRQQVLDDKASGGIKVLADEAAEEEHEARRLARRSNNSNTTNNSSRRSAKSNSSTPQSDSLKGLRDRVTGSMHGRQGGIIGVESGR